MYFSNTGQSLEEARVLLLGAKAHHVFDAEAVIPAAVENHDLARRREVRHVALHIHLRLLAVGRRRQGDEPEDARADALGDRADGAALACGIASFEDHDDTQALVLDPLLEPAQLGLELAQFLHVFFPREFFGLFGFGMLAHGVVFGLQLNEMHQALGAAAFTSALAPAA